MLWEVSAKTKDILFTNKSMIGRVLIETKTAGILLCN